MNIIRKSSWSRALGMAASAALMIAVTPVLGQPASGPCVVPDDGSGTVSLPPTGCEYLSPMDVHKILEGLPPGTTVELDASHGHFFCVNPDPTGHCGEQGGQLGGERERFQSELKLTLNFTGMLGHVTRDITLPVLCETHTGPRTPGMPVQSFPTDMFLLGGQLPIGDPDFDLLRIKGGTSNGMPSPGHTTLTQLPGGGGWHVDSFFDVFYSIEYQGAMGGHIPAGGGITMPRGIRMRAAAPPMVPGATPIGLVVIGGLVVATGTVLLLWRRRAPSSTAA